MTLATKIRLTIRAVTGVKLKREEGATRYVILTTKWAFKFPNLKGGVFRFIRGFFCNMQEAAMSKKTDPRLCDVLWRGWCGWLIVMRTAEPIEKMSPRDYLKFSNLPVEAKLNSFGRLDGKIVAVDYGG